MTILYVLNSYRLIKNNSVRLHRLIPVIFHFNDLLI